MNCNVTVNEFALRQTKDSGKTYSDLSFNHIAQYAESQLIKGLYSQGYRKGVLLVHVENDMKQHFFCPFVKIDSETKLNASSVKRRDDERPYIQIRAQSGTLCETGKVDLILYHNRNPIMRFFK